LMKSFAYERSFHRSSYTSLIFSYSDGMLSDGLLMSE
jgi:hypothetical protein